MPIDVNSYNAQFSQFVQFAERQMQAGKAKAFASLGAEGATGLAARRILAVQRGNGPIVA